MTSHTPVEYAGLVVDICAEAEVVEEYDVEIRDNVVVRARLQLNTGFVDLYRNFDSGKTAYAWIVDDERIYGAYNTGSWHVHPYRKPGDHRDSNEISLEGFLSEVERILTDTSER